MPTLRIFSIPLVLLLLCGCSLPVKKSPECKTCVQNVKEDWFFDEERNIFRVEAKGGRKNSDFLSGLMKHKDCLRGGSQRQVRKLFGLPSKIEGKLWKYYVMEVCNNSEKDGCQFLLLTFDNEEALQDIEYVAREVSH